MPYLSVIIPAYNEEKRIEKTLLSIYQYLAKQNYDYEILVVNDGSNDRTSEVVSNLKEKIKNLILINNKENRGKGYVVKQGMLEAKGKLRLFMDADNSTTIDHLEKFYPYLKENGGDYDIVIASIGIKGAKVAYGEKFYKRIFGKLGNLWIQFWLLPGIWDTQRGFKLFSAKAGEDVFKRVEDPGWSFDVEALAIAKKLGYKIKEIPINWQNDPQSKVKLSAYPKFLIAVLKIRLKLWFKKDLL